ncbi:MAG: enoyl-CoA hydratase/isomerase family protein [Gammaproteobacteria bacterium]|nr:enoyl-CoA hydratase/isomerase family protein [Gammaproteobacteria bacterium]MCP5416864.1 enoyl-CoA hydratase/isomerase family protein [Chromatiaceae bacterium]
MNFANIILEELEPGIFLLTINRPEVYNALNQATVADIKNARDQVEKNPDARVLLVTGAGSKAFVAGADIKEMHNMSGIQGRDFSLEGLRVFRSLETLPIPVIAVVNGYCLGGGCELAMSCDWIIASENAYFGQPEVNLGITPGFGGTQRLPRLIGRGRTMELTMTGRQISAEEAKEWGLVNHVYAQGELMQKALETARNIVKKGPVALELTKDTILRGQDMDLDNACALESKAFGLSFSTDDQKEGMAAFLEKRAAVFHGK